MNAIAQTYLWVRVIVLMFTVMALVFAALLSSRPRRASAGLIGLGAIVNMVGAVVIILLSGVHISPIWGAVFGVVGAVAGWFAGRSSRVAVEGDKAAIRAAAWGVWLVAVFEMLAVAAVLFGTTTTFAAMALLLVFSAAFSGVCAVAQIVKVNAVRSGARGKVGSASATPAG